MKRSKYYLVAALVLGVLVVVVSGLLMYFKTKDVKLASSIFVSADEDPGNTLKTKTENPSANILVSGTVSDKDNNPQSGTITIAGVAYTVDSSGEFTALLEPGVYTVTFVQNEVKVQLAPQVIQLINSGVYSFIVQED